MTTPIVALDVPRAADALALVERLHGLCKFYKVGLELFAAEGPRVVAAVRECGADVFLDLKLHDIPNTVRGAVIGAASHGARLITVHAAGGRAMLEAAQEAAAKSGGCEILAVTVLTSLDGAALAGAWGRDAATLDVEAEVLRMAALAAEAGLHGVVCSGR
ncbi:MAG TPA: orotidine-5'-phosphate decarboxylase, partial [Gemmatimonadaceae bacterium]